MGTDVGDIEIRTPTDDQWPAICAADGRAFGHHYTTEDIEARRPMHDMGRFRVAMDGDRIAAVAGSYALDVTVPGGAAVPMGGVTWVSTVTTHRRRGLMRATVGAVHDDIDDRGEPVASLYASEGGIYETMGYGIATQARVTTLDPRMTTLRREYRLANNPVRYIEGEGVIPFVTEIWDRFRRVRAGECGRSDFDQRYFFEQREKEQGSLTPTFYLHHPDGYACYRIEAHWSDGQPGHTLNITELAAVTPDAFAALWQTLLDMDLIAEIKTRVLPIDTPLPYLLENQRALRTTHLSDAVWVNVRDIAIAFGARNYRTSDRLIVEVEGARWAIEGGPGGAAVKRVRTRPDLVATHAALSSLLYGGVTPTALVAGRRMTARDDATLARADLFFPTTIAPHCQSPY